MEHSRGTYAEELKALARSIVEGPDATEDKPSLVHRILSPFRNGARRNGATPPLTPATAEAPTHG